MAKGRKKDVTDNEHTTEKETETMEQAPARNENSDTATAAPAVAAAPPAQGKEVIFGCKQEVADELKMSLRQLGQLLRRYPFESIGVPAKIMGRWRVARSDVHRWFRHVQTQELRHPRSRRMRPVEAPGLQDIRGR